MKITIIGASAGIGLETLKRALDRGHEVITLSRSDIQLAGMQTFTAIKGSANIKPDVLKAIENAEAVIVTLGTGKNMKTTTLFSDFAKLLVEINRTDIPFIFVTGFGTGESQNYVSWFVKMFLKYFLKDVYADKTKMEEIISYAPLQWTFVRPGRLLDKPLTEKYRIETELYKGINIGEINRADVADFLVKQAEKPTNLKKYVAISEK
ncbi:NAD(P)-dependent oxidoreductase [Lacihabitans sp. LS3-19]|uniref:NAD(P)-dependent oxidoreductase n=1 Tax=Lacihabitans sp. LS3-19 TaxID=2487335 RepID=UPI0020CC8433|nr:NAD(P)H-binding protein [Lacihabitans sp. LS3-19]MCP9768068.1 NAD(P)-dependent oxidoreductase [Lacihabitans sp. LS3-19]